MAINYLTILGKHFCSLLFSAPSMLFSVQADISCIATAVEVEFFLSKGQLCIPHTCGHLSVLTTCALLCLNDWSRLGLVHWKDLKAAASASNIKGEESDCEMDEGRDAIKEDSSEDEQYKQYC